MAHLVSPNNPTSVSKRVLSLLLVGRRQRTTEGRAPMLATYGCPVLVPPDLGQVLPLVKVGGRVCRRSSLPGPSAVLHDEGGLEASASGSGLLPVRCSVECCGFCRELVHTRSG